MLAQSDDEDSYLAERREALQIASSASDRAVGFPDAGKLNRIYALENEQRELRYALLSADHFSRRQDR